jgi:predicted dienelactone hydrolase
MRRFALAIVCVAAFNAVTPCDPAERSAATQPLELPSDLPRDLPALPVEHAAQAVGKTITLAGREVDVWRPAGGGAAPIIVFSHGFAGCGTQSTFLTAALAEAGYLVVAPRHADAWCGQFSLSLPAAPFWRPESWTEASYRDRRDDIVAVLDALHRDPAFAGKIDWPKLGLMGHSLGGYTVLGLAGGWPGWRIPGVKAVVALSPFCAPFLAAGGGLGGVSAPVEYQGGTYDIGITPVVSQRGGCYDATPAPALYVEFQGAGHLAWTDLVATDHAGIIFYVRAFFDGWLRGQAPAQPWTRRSGVSDLRSK